MNNVAKAYANRTQSSWIQLVDNMFDLVIKEVEKSVIGMGEYQFTSSYKSLEIPNEWFVMSSEQRQKHLSKVFRMKSKPVDSNLAVRASPSSNVLSISPEESGITTISAVLLERIWRKAEKLLSTPERVDR